MEAAGGAVPQPQPKPSPEPQPKAQPTAVRPSQSVAQPEQSQRPQAADGRLPGIISIKMKPVSAQVRPAVQEEEVQPLTQERLQEAWERLIAEWSESNPEQAAVLQGHEVELKERNLFAIKANNSNFERELRTFKTSMLERLRSQLRCPALQCRVEVYVERQESKAYQPSEKYDAMLQSNPELARLRMMFPDIDY
ncbi:MAG: hypothetical protein AUK63_503 [bacterium P3]|nr:MAG: hypothetical protein AUK63_503 [bacterium P3]KWW41959.1 MAG: hypothetical protein F083_610 [bacterium F083]